MEQILIAADRIDGSTRLKHTLFKYLKGYDDYYNMLTTTTFNPVRL